MKIYSLKRPYACLHFILLIVCTLASALQLKSQAPDLKAAGSFTLFTAAGAIGNTGASSITGSIGTFTGAITGFPPGNVSGSIHNADSLTTVAAADIDAAYTYMNGITCDSTIDSTMGNNQVLYPGVYCITTAASLNGTLTLDARGDASALFIFKIDGAFSTGKYANVLLYDSASSANVYWQINGQFTLGDSSVFTGNIVGNGAIIMLEGSELTGRGLSRSGAISLFTATADSTGIMNPLPAHLLAFTAVNTLNGTIINWTSANDDMHNYYTLEHSYNGRVWYSLGVVSADSLAYEGISTYTVTEEMPFSPYSFYRLIQTDCDGQAAISHSISLFTGKAEQNGLRIYPNPGKGFFTMHFENSDDQTCLVNVFDACGLLVLSADVSENILDLNNLKDGIYTIISQNDQGIFNSKIILQH